MLSKTLNRVFPLSAQMHLELLFVFYIFTCYLSIKKANRKQMYHRCRWAVLWRLSGIPLWRLSGGNSRSKLRRIDRVLRHICRMKALNMHKMDFSV